MNDRSATTRSGGVREIGSGGEVAHVAAVEHDDPVVGTQSPRQLPVPDVGGDHRCGAPAQEDVGEPARGSPGIQAPATGRRAQASHLECVEGPDQLVRTARDVVRAVAGSSATTSATSVVTAVAGLVATTPETFHPALADQLGGLLARTRQAPPDQLGVQTQPTGWHGPSGVRTRVQGRPGLPRGPARTRRRGRPPAGRRNRPRESSTLSTRSSPVRTGWLGCQTLVVEVLLAHAPRLSGRVSPSASTGAPVRSRCRHAATATARHQSSGAPPPSTRIRPLSTTALQPPHPAPSAVASGAGWECSRPVSRPARYVGRCLRRRGHQLGQAGDPGQHEQRRQAGVVGSLDVGVEPIADHQRAHARRPGGPPRPAAPERACRPPRG